MCRISRHVIEQTGGLLGGLRGFAEVVDAALGFVLAWPATRAWVVRVDGPLGAGPAANRRVTLMPKGMVG